MKSIAFTRAARIAAVIALGSACGADPGDVTVEGFGRANLSVVRTDIVSDEPGAEARDEMLVNAWGLAFDPAGAAWVAATESGVTRVYDANGATMLPAVAMPGTGMQERAAPTGQVYNGDPSAFFGDRFIVVTEGGTIAGWEQAMGGQATERVDNSARGAVYKGVTIVESASGPRLFAADFRSEKVDVFDAGYIPVEAELTDPELPAGFAPFNVAELDGDVIVTYALKDEAGEDDVAGAGNGYVSRFRADGTFVTRLISRGELDSPWGVALAPPSFAAAPGRLLIGNFGDGLVHAYRLDSTKATARATHEGELVDASGTALRIDGLWALALGPDAGGFSSSTLYYTAGPAGETHGTFGRLESRQQTAGSSTGSGGSGSATAY